DSAKLNLAYCHIVAPVAGRIGLRLVDEGNYVTPADSNGLVVLTRTKPITVIFSLPQQNEPAVTSLLAAGGGVSVDAYDQDDAVKLASGTLDAADNQVDPATGTFRLRALFSNDKEVLYPNQFVNVRMRLRTKRNVTVIPAAAIEHDESGTFVYV